MPRRARTILDVKNEETESSRPGATTEESVQYGEPTPARWYDEGNVSFDAWSVQVSFPAAGVLPELTRTYWFKTEHGARIFVEERKAG